MAKKKRARRGLAQISTGALQAELRRRQYGVRSLERARDRMMAKLSMLESKISDYGGAVVGAVMGKMGRGRRRGRPAGRPRNEMSLPEALERLLRGKTMSVTDAAGAVQRAGYRTSAANFRTIVNAALLKGDRFRKVSRGKYTAR